MPKKTKDNLEEEKTSKSKTKREPVAKKATGKIVASKKETKKATPSKKETVNSTKKTSKKSEGQNVKTPSTNKVSSKSKIAKTETVTKKKTSTKARPTKKSTEKKDTKKTTTKKTVKKDAKTKPQIVEYYDLPFTYNQTLVKVLAQTPTTLFIYWDISDTDKKKYIKEYGKKFFENTKPVLIINNKTLSYSFEIEINDYANNWYLHVADSRCEYTVELGRRPLNYEISIPNDYMYVASSNVIESPNNHILCDELGKTVFFRNVKTNITEEKLISSISHIKNIGKIYNIYELYKKIYKDELKENEVELNFPSSS